MANKSKTIRNLRTRKRISKLPASLLLKHLSGFLVTVEDFNNIKVSRTYDGKMHEYKGKEMFPVLNMFPLTKKQQTNKTKKLSYIIKLLIDLVSNILRETNHFSPT